MCIIWTLLFYSKPHCRKLDTTFCRFQHLLFQIWSKTFTQILCSFTDAISKCDITKKCHHTNGHISHELLGTNHYFLVTVKVISHLNLLYNKASQLWENWYFIWASENANITPKLIKTNFLPILCRLTDNSLLHLPIVPEGKCFNFQFKIICSYFILQFSNCYISSVISITLQAGSTK